MRILLGEFIGTFVLVGIGCGSVGIHILYPSFTLPYIALTWSFAVALGIYLSRPYSDAHLNPAVTFAMFLNKRIVKAEISKYLTGQFFGALFASLILFLSFNSSLIEFEGNNNIVRDSMEGIATGKMFGEYYLNETIQTAFIAEGMGTCILVLMIFVLTSKKLYHNKLTPLFIGITVGLLIMVIAPITQAGLNPFRDLAPRIISYYTGWKTLAFSAEYLGWFTVYVVAPISGSYLGVLLYKELEKSIQ